jgi:Muconolactone delta-isomerase
MPQFMVEFELPYEMSEDFVSMIPQQRQKINEMMEQGKIFTYALSADRQKLWCVMRAQTELEVMAFIAEFPLIDFMRPTIHELMFNNTVAIRMPLFSLN